MGISLSIRISPRLGSCKTRSGADCEVFSLLSWWLAFALSRFERAKSMVMLPKTTVAEGDNFAFRFFNSGRASDDICYFDSWFCNTAAFSTFLGCTTPPNIADTLLIRYYGHDTPKMLPLLFSRRRRIRATSLRPYRWPPWASARRHARKIAKATCRGFFVLFSRWFPFWFARPLFIYASANAFIYTVSFHYIRQKPFCAIIWAAIYGRYLSFSNIMI